MIIIIIIYFVNLTSLSILSILRLVFFVFVSETWIRSATRPAELIDSTPPGYSPFSTPPAPTSATHLNPFLLECLSNKRTFHSELCCSSLLFIRIFIHNSNISQAQLILFNIYRPPPPSSYFNLSLPFLTNSHRFFPTQPPPHMNSSLLAISISTLTTSAILKQSIF